MTTSYKEAVTHSSDVEHFTGRVKWFNNKAGYGFITISDGPRSGTDIFVHHSAINIDDNQYKYLIEGEYVVFDLVKTDSDQHDCQASKVSGIGGGKLMCETRRDVRAARTEYNSSKQDKSYPKQKKSYKDDKKLRDQDENKKDWTLVEKNKPQKKRGRPPRNSNSVTPTEAN